MKRWALHSLLLKSVHITEINQDPVIGITAATEVIVVMVVIEIRAAIEDSEVIIVDIPEIIPVVLSTIHKGNKNPIVIIHITEIIAVVLSTIPKK
jgi:hypothetical protein